jgi:hypothetical protein
MSDILADIATMAMFIKPANPRAMMTSLLENAMSLQRS